MKSIMKKFLALVMVGVMTFGMVAMAAPSPSASTVVATPAEAALQAVKTQAAAAGMTTEEFVNNTVTSAPGVEDAAPVGIPTGAYINGVKTNYTVRMTKSTAAVAAEAKTLGKKVLNAFAVSNMPKGDIQIALYMPTVKAGQKISVYQKIDGKWVLCKSSVRAEHIDVILVGNGPVAVVLN